MPFSRTAYQIYLTPSNTPCRNFAIHPNACDDVVVVVVVFVVVVVVVGLVLVLVIVVVLAVVSIRFT